MRFPVEKIKLIKLNLGAPGRWVLNMHGYNIYFVYVPTTGEVRRHRLNSRRYPIATSTRLIEQVRAFIALEGVK